MAISIPTDITIVTLRHEGRTLDQRWTEAHAGAVFRFASALIDDRMDIEFRLASCEGATAEMPPGINPIAVDTSGYHYLSHAFRAGEGVRVILVDRLAQKDLGGRSRHETRVCIVPYDAGVPSLGRTLAHELVHLLEVEHVDEARRAGPGQERQQAAWARNLMYSGVLNPDANITAAQRRQARNSALARRFTRRR